MNARQGWFPVVALGFGLALPLAASAEPWMAPGDVTLRHDLQQLSDAGLLTGPTMSWPIGWSQVARELGKLNNASLSNGQRAAVERLKARAAGEMRAGEDGIAASVSGAADPTQLRTFEYTPREEGEVSPSHSSVAKFSFAPIVVKV